MRATILPLLCLPALLLCLACPGLRRPAAPADTCDGRPCIQVGGYNIQWLGAKRRFELPLRSPEEVERIAALIADELDLEVVTLQEVNTAVDGEEEGELAYARDRYRWLREALEARGYELAAGRSGNAQRVVVAWDADEVDSLGSARELDVRSRFDFGGDCQRGGLRRPLAANLKAGEFDFWVIGLHLKSKRDGECSDRIRAAQSEDLVAAVDELVAGSGEPDVVLAGDFNALIGEPSIAALRSAGFEALTAPGLRARSSGEISYLVGQYKSLIDHVMIRRGPTAEWVEGSTFVYRPGSGQAHRDYLDVFSDHAPMWASFWTDLDDD